MGTIRDNKLYLNEPVDGGNNINLCKWADIVLAVNDIKYLCVGMSIRLCTTLKKRVISIFELIYFID